MADCVQVYFDPLKKGRREGRWDLFPDNDVAKFSSKLTIIITVHTYKEVYAKLYTSYIWSNLIGQNVITMVQVPIHFVCMYMYLTASLRDGTMDRVGGMQT